MGKPSAKQQVTAYRMSAHFGVSISADAVKSIWVNDKQAWAGRSTTLEDLSVYLPDLYGGERDQGGLVGTITHLPGAPDQVLPDDLAGKMAPGKTGLQIPGFRGLTSFFFHGGGTGFLWSHNNPIVATSLEFEVERASKTELDPSKAMIGDESNPAYMIYECLTNTVWGMGGRKSSINVASFQAAGNTLYDEAFGLSMIWTRQTEIESFVNEIIDHIQAALYLDPQTGLWTLTLLRDDYDRETLPVIDHDNATLDTFSRRLWGEAANEITVTWMNPLTEKDETVTWQDLASVTVQGVISDTRNYYGVRNRNLAMQLAVREVRMSSAPLAQATVRVNRQAWNVKPGQCVIANWPDKNVSNVVFRVVDVDYGDSSDSEIKLSLLEDVFSLEKPPIETTPGTGWTNPLSPPEPMTSTEVITLPTYMTLSADFQNAAIDLEYPEVLAGVLAYHVKPDVFTYDLRSDEVTSTGATKFQSQGLKSVVERTILPTAMPAAAETRFQDALILDKARGPDEGSFLFIGAGSDAGIEIAQVVGFDDSTSEWILARGVLDTVPASHPIGTPVWVVNKGARIVDDRTIRAAGETVTYKLLTRGRGGFLPLDDAPTLNEALTGRPHLPLRPANVKINGQAFGSLTFSGQEAFTLTWATRNRTLEDGQVVRWGDGAVAPEYAQGTVIRVYDQTNALVYEEVGLWTELEKELPAEWFFRYSSIRIVLSSMRDDLESLQAYSVSVTGLPANSSYPPPPAAPDHGPPPNIDPAPAEGTWTATGSIFTTDGDGKVISSVPAIVVTGTRERSDAAQLLVRYRKSGSNDWFYIGGVILTDEPAISSSTAVTALTVYNVQVAYQSTRNTLSQWRALPDVTTGKVIAGQLGDLTEAFIKEQLEEAFDFINDLGSLTNEHTTAVLELVMRNIDLKKYVDPLIHDGNTPVKKVLQQEIIDRTEGQEEIFQVIDLIGIVAPDKSAIYVSDTTFKISPTESLVNRLQVIQSTFEDVNASILLEQQTRASADSAQATQIAGLSVSLGQAQAAIITEQNARVTADSALSSQLTIVTASVNGHTSQIAQLFSADAIMGTKYGISTNFNGRVAGFSLLNGAGGVSNFTVQADIFAVIAANDTGYTVPFSIFGGQTHMTDVVVHTLAAGIINAVHINASQITADKIVGGAVSNMLPYENGSPMFQGIGYETQHMAFYYYSDGGKHLVTVYGSLGTTTTQAAGTVVKLYCDGIQVGWGELYCPGSWGGTSVTFPTQHTPGAGYHVYSVTYTGTPGSGQGRVNRSLVVITELKK